MEEAIRKFDLKGKIHFWEFREKNPNMRCWNFTANMQGCESFIQLLELMQSSPYSSKKSILLSTPEISQIEVPNNRNVNWRTKSKLNLIFKKNETSVWSIKVPDDVLEISFGSEKMEKFINAVRQVKAGHGDFAISDDNDDNVLYFWWYK